MRPDPYVLANELSVASADLAAANKRVVDLLWADECKGKQIVEFNEALITGNTELANLHDDIATHVQVSADQRGEIERLRNDNASLNLELSKHTITVADVGHRNQHLRAALAAMDRELQLIAGQCGTPDATEGCRLILRTVARARDAGKAAIALAEGR